MNYLGYELERSPLPKDSECGTLFRIIRKLNGREVGLIDAKFLSTFHRNKVVQYWNKQGEQMARTPSPVTGEIMHWSYEVTDRLASEKEPEYFLGAGI